MTVKQISIFLENRPGQLRDITASLGKQDINIRAITVAETADYGIIRLIVEEPDKAMALLKEQEFLAVLSDVVAVAVADQPGGLSKILDLMLDAGINIEYMYSVFGKTEGEAFMIFKVNDTQKFKDLLQANGIKEADSSELG
jgi:hypothetical protein